MLISCTDVAVPRPGGAVSDQHAPEGLVDAARDAGLRNDLDLEPVLHTPRSLDSLVPGPVTAQGPAQIGMTLRKIFVAFMVLLSLALSACGGDNKNPIAPTPAPAPTPTTAPDLVVDAPTVNDNSPATGAPFTLSATVRNAGDGESAATTLRFYRSTDGTITTSDTVAGTDAVAGTRRVGELPRVGGSDRAVDRRHVLLRCVRGRGDRRVRHDQQLLGVGDGHGTGAADIPG